MRFEWIIVVGIALAAAIATITVQLTRDHFVEELPRDFERVEEVTAEIQSELSRLYFRYEERLVKITDLLHRYARSPFPAEREAARAVGVMTLSLIDFNGNELGVHREVRIENGGSEAFDRVRFPALTIFGIEVERPSSQVLIVGPEWFETDQRDSGWVRNVGSVLYFWRKLSSGLIVVIGIDEIELQASINEWFIEEDSFPFRSLSGGFTRLIDPSRKTIWDNGEELIFGVRPRTYSATSQLGTWQLEATPPVAEGITWNMPFLVSGLGLSVLVFAVSLLSAFALRRATKLAERRVTFVNSVSHELRTPITNILLNTDIAKDVLENDPDDAAKHLDRVSDETSRLSRLVDNVLTFSRREKNGHQLRPAAFNPDPVVEEVAANFRSLFDRAGIDVKMDFSVTAHIMADCDALAQILTNLFSNAEKYAASGGILELHSEKIGANWHLRVSDRGPGISSSAGEKIFEPFRRSGDSINEGVTGTGLGLTIARDLAREMSGDLRLIASERGAVFELVLPVVET